MKIIVTVPPVILTSSFPSSLIIMAFVVRLYVRTRRSVYTAAVRGMSCSQGKPSNHYIIKGRQYAHKLVPRSRNSLRASVKVDVARLACTALSTPPTCLSDVPMIGFAPLALSRTLQTTIKHEGARCTVVEPAAGQPAFWSTERHPRDPALRVLITSS